MTDEAEEEEKEEEENDYIDVQSINKNSSDYDAAGNWEAGYGQ